MVTTELAKTIIQELLQKNKANFLQISLAGNVKDGFQTTITFESKFPAEFITITTNPLILIDPRSYVKFANSILDFDSESNELKFQLKEEICQS